MKIGDTVTIATGYGMLPGIHRGKIVGKFGPWFHMMVFNTARGTTDRVDFHPSQVVPDDTPTTQSVGALNNGSLVRV